MVMTSDETQIQIFANWPMPHAKCMTRDNRKSPEYRVVAAIRKLRTDTNCPAGKYEALFASGTPKVARNAFNIGEVWNPVCCHDNKTVKLKL